MTVGTVLVLSSARTRYELVIASLVDASGPAFVVVPIPGTAPLAARTCAAINAIDPVPPLTIITFEETCTLLPPVAFAQRAAHRRVDEYVLVNPVLPEITDSWPDARMTVFVDDLGCDVARIALLRGWTVRETDHLAEWSPDRA
ncbi:MAG: hypothetical protein IPO93_06650 [Actinobacteria bacterium]|nr:hypothetical protein [Actinomycetota bacterium]